MSSRKKPGKFKKSRLPSEFQKPLVTKISEGERKFSQINRLKKIILNAFNKDKIVRFEKCLQYLRENQAKDPARLAKSLSDIAEKISEPETKLALLAEAVELNPDDTVALNSYGTALANYNQPAKAFEQFEKSLAIEPENTVALLSYAIALELEGEYATALTHLEKIALDKLPTNLAGFIYLHLGRLCHRTQQEAKGDEYFEQAIENKSNIGRLNAAKQLFSLNTSAARESCVRFLQAINRGAAG
jgi:tetratricopeptide (TPR) repeat protein